MASLWSAPRPLGASGLASWSLQRPGHSHHGPARWSGQPQPHPLTQPRPLSAGPRSLGGSVPVTVPGCPPRSPSLHSSSSLSTSPLSSLSQSLSGPLVSSAMTPPQQPPALRSEPGALGPSAASYSSLGEPGPPTWLHRLDSGAATARGGPLSSLLAVLWGKRMGCTRSLLSGWPCLSPGSRGTWDVTWDPAHSGTSPRFISSSGTVHSCAAPDTLRPHMPPRRRPHSSRASRLKRGGFGGQGSRGDSSDLSSSSAYAP